MNSVDTALLIIILFLISFTFLVFIVYTKLKTRFLAQLDAISSYNTATNLFILLSVVRNSNAVLGKKSLVSQTELAVLSSEFTNIVSSTQNNPFNNSLSVEIYENIATKYKSLSSDIRNILITDTIVTKKNYKKASSGVTKKQSKFHESIYSREPVGPGGPGPFPAGSIKIFD